MFGLKENLLRKKKGFHHVDPLGKDLHKHFPHKICKKKRECEQPNVNGWIFLSFYVTKHTLEIYQKNPTSFSFLSQESTFHFLSFSYYPNTLKVLPSNVSQDKDNSI